MRLRTDQRIAANEFLPLFKGKGPPKEHFTDSVADFP